MANAAAQPTEQLTLTLMGAPTLDSGPGIDSAQRSGAPCMDAGAGAELEADPESARHHQELDRLLKTVMSLDRGRVLRWIFLPELCQELELPGQAPLLLAQLDKEFADVRRFGDYLLEVMFAVLRWAAHFEFQKRKDPQMGPRMVRYQGAARLKHGLELVSLVLNMSEGAQVFRREEYVIGRLSRIGWMDISVPRLVGRWPEETDSPMAEMLRVLVAGRLDRERVRDLLGRLQRLGLGRDDCRQVMLMLSFLHSVQHGETELNRDLIDEELAMIEIEDSFIYQAVKARYVREGQNETKRAWQTAIGVTCETVGIPLTDERRSYLTTLDVAQLEQLNRSIAQTRSWPVT